MVDFPPQEEFEYEHFDTKLNIHLTWPESGKKLPAPLDCVFIFIHPNTVTERLHDEYSKLKYIVHKIVISETDFEGENFASEIDAKHTTMNENSDARI